MKISIYSTFVILLLVAVTAQNIYASTGYGGNVSGSAPSRYTIPTITVNPPVSPTNPVIPTVVYVLNNDLYYGITSPEVVQLQERLRTLGFFIYPTSTGFFGNVTLKAVRDFQIANGIRSTGNVGPLTRAALNQ